MNRKPGSFFNCAKQLIGVAVFALAACSQPPQTACTTPNKTLPTGPSFVIADTIVVDGTGAPRFAADVRVADGNVVELGEICAGQQDEVLDGSGLILAPGFIDTHSHHDRDPAEVRGMGAISQGITTIVVGADGGSQTPLQERRKKFERSPFPLNVAAYTGHNTLRAWVMGSDFRREASAQEVQEMSELLAQELQMGSLGLSTGLEYDPGIYSSTAEVVELAALTHRLGGRYASHIRSEDRTLMAAVDEFLEIAAATGIPSHLSHIKIAMLDLWGQAPTLLSKLDDARAQGFEITADVYPYDAWQSTLTVLLPERDFTDVVAAQYVLDHLAPADGLTLGLYKPDPSLVGKNVAEIAKLWEMGEAETFLKLIRDAYPTPPSAGELNELVIGRSMSESDVETFAQWPHANIASDGASTGGHPRGYGAFPRAIRLFVRERGLMTLETLVHKMTAQAANNVGISGRGSVEPGAPADLVLFSEDEIADTATMDAPTMPATGIRAVWVNGVLVWDGNTASGALPGEFILRTD